MWLLASQMGPLCITNCDAAIKLLSVSCLIAGKRGMSSQRGSGVRSELKGKDEILKQRRIEAKKQSFQSSHESKGQRRGGMRGGFKGGMGGGSRGGGSRGGGGRGGSSRGGGGRGAGKSGRGGRGSSKR